MTTANLPRGEPGAIGHLPALDGMRAVAVILVFLFHLRVAGFGAGYLGVDVFFVLSGFLITSLLIAEMKRTGRIALAAFWSRRVRRLLPALVVFLIAVAVVGRFTYTFSERASLRGDLQAATAYMANWRFIATSAYFSNTGVESPLQHTWSLAIEEQFYVLWPLLLAGLFVVFRRARLSVAIPAVLGTIASAVLLGALFRPGEVERAYMGTDARIFEPLIGAIGAVVVAGPGGRALIERGSARLVTLGSVGMIAGLVLIRPDTSVYYLGGAFLFSIATLMVLAPMWVGRGGAVGRALEWKPLVWLGVISYGVYLWHWPVTLWLGGRAARGADAVLLDSAIVVITVAVAAASYYLVERPIREGRRRTARHASIRRLRRPRRALVAVPFAMLLVAGVSLATTNVPLPPPGVPVLMLVGDSVPMRLEPALEVAGDARGWRVISAAQGACSVTGEVTLEKNGQPDHVARDCPSVPDQQDALIRQVTPDVVLWWDRWSVADFQTARGEAVKSGTRRFWQIRTATLRAAVRRLTARGARVVFVAIEPPGEAIGSRCSDKRCADWVEFQIDHYADITSRWNALMESYAEQHPDQASFISVTDAVCREDVSRCNDSIDGTPARPDGLHYEGAAATKVATLMLRLLAPLIRVQRWAG